MTSGVDDWGSSTDEGWKRDIQDWRVAVAHLQLENVYQQISRHSRCRLGLVFIVAMHNAVGRLGNCIFVS